MPSKNNIVRQFKNKQQKNITIKKTIKKKQLNPKCKCGVTSVKRTVKKEGENKGKKFFICANGNICKFFKWVEEMNNYDGSKFHKGTCFRCGKFGHNLKDCQEIYDYFSNLIPVGNKIYDQSRFKKGTCYRCGRYGHILGDCKETCDYYGILIPK